jgi:integrase
MPRKARRRGWGQGQLEQIKSGYWRVRWREPDGARKTAKYADRGDAEAVLARILNNVRDGKPSGHESAAPGTGPLLSELAKKWLDRREKTHRSWRDDRNRWTKHLEPEIGHMRPDDVDQAALRRIVEKKLAGGLSSKSVGNIVMVLSTFYTDLLEQGHAKTNPARSLPRSTRRLIKGTHDPKQTPFIEKQVDIARVYSALAQPFATMFAIGALGGLRPGEVLALEWGDVDLGARRMLVQRQVRHSKVGPTKSGKPRLVPIIGPLAKILAEWKLATGGAGLVFKPLVTGRRKDAFVKDITVRRALRKALEACGLPKTWTWYQCSRHTYASQHVMGGGSLATLRDILGHSSVTVTERYAHLNPGLFKPEDLLQLSVEMSREGGAVVNLAAARAEKAGQDGHEMTTATVRGSEVGV